MDAGGARQLDGQESEGAVALSPEDAEIAAAIGRGDHRGALALCARHHAAAVGRLCMAMVGSQAEAEDLAQETLLAAHDGFEGWRADGSVRAWLSAIARRKCARHLERSRRQQNRLRLVHDAARAGTEDHVLLKQRAERARAALSHIRPSEREALLLRYVAELSFRELASACGIEEAAARKRVSRAIARLREIAVKE